MGSGGLRLLIILLGENECEFGRGRAVRTSACVDAGEVCATFGMCNLITFEKMIIF